MERTEGPKTPYEVYCYSCHVTFAAGTPRCVHCGQRLGRPAKTGADGVAELDAEAIEVNPLKRAGGISLWVLIAVGAAITRMCSGN